MVLKMAVIKNSVFLNSSIVPMPVAKMLYCFPHFANALVVCILSMIKEQILCRAKYYPIATRITVRLL